jgi:hypothetical protein
MSLPPVRIEENLRLIGHHALNGYPNVGEGLAMKIVDDRRYLYAANDRSPGAFSILDVSDPTRPEVLFQLPTEHADVRANSLALYGDILLVAKQTEKFGIQPGGFHVYDVSEPAQPREITFYDTSGPHSKGVHRVSFMDGRYAHISTGSADFEPKQNSKDHQFYMILDLEDPAHPVEVSRWWLPGQRKGDSEDYVRHVGHDFGFRVHHTMVYPQRPDRAYLGYIDAGFIILDISDKSNPQFISRLDYHPPLPGFTHTIVPLFGRGIAVVSDEATGDEGTDWPKRYWIMDIRDETNVVMLSSFPVPDGFDELHRVGGRIGAHNLHENEPLPGSAQLTNTAVATWFSAGLRVYDIRDPFTPKEIAAFLPETPVGQRGSRISDVFVEDRGYIYAGDRAKGGLYILEYDGPIPLD